MKKIVRNQKGFTLVEIIAVLVILGILAAVAIPKYFNLQEDAKNKALQGAIAEGKARVTQYASQYLLSNGSFPDNYDSATVGSNAGDFTLEFGTSGNDITIKATGETGSVKDATSTASILRPGVNP